MKLKNIYLISFAILTGGLFSGCAEDIENFDNQIFLSNKAPESVLVMSTAPDEERSFVLSIAKPESQDVTFTVRAASELVSVYELQNYTSGVEMLPEAHYEIVNANGKILAGTLNSEPVTIKFKDVKGLDVKKVYVLPITVANASIGVLASASTYYYVFREGHLVNLAANIKENAIRIEKWATPDKLKDMHTVTAEALIRIHSLPNTVNTLMGIEGGFLLRFGDAGISTNQLQVACKDNNHRLVQTPVPVGQWVHVAVTFNSDEGKAKVYYNGEEVGDFSGITNGPVDWSPEYSNDNDGKARSFWVGHSYDNNRWLDADIAEIRIWNRVLEQTEIQEANHFYQVDPASDGLVVYWKLDEKSDDIKDATSNGNNGKANKTMEWVEVSLPANN